MDYIKNKDKDIEIHHKLKEIGNNIKESWIKDLDKTEYMIKFTEMIKEMITYDDLEEYFSNNKTLLSYFMGDYLVEIINYILIQPIIYGDNGDFIAIDLLFHIFKLFLKFHKNENYAPLFENIRNIFDNKENKEKYTSFFTAHKYYNKEEEKKYDYLSFNEQFCSEFKKQNKRFNPGDEVEFLVDNLHPRAIIDKKNWVRGKIKDIRNDEYVIEYYGDNEKLIPINNFQVFEKNTKIIDWDWRTNLKKYDVIDCFDRNRWYPATIIDVKKIEENGNKNIEYRIGFRLYTKHFKNPEDENDTYDKHIDLWNAISSLSVDTNYEEYIGDQENYDERIDCHSKRIQKFGAYSSLQQKKVDFPWAYSDYEKNFRDDYYKDSLSIANYKLIKDINIQIDNFYNYEVDGKKNYILGKHYKFFYYYAYLLKLIEKENTFPKFIEILKDKPNIEEIYTIIFILNCCFSYLHKDYFFENFDTIKNSLLDYINGLNEKEIKNNNRCQDLIKIVLILLYKIKEINIDVNDSSKSKSINLNNFSQILLNKLNSI